MKEEAREVPLCSLGPEPAEQLRLEINRLTGGRSVDLPPGMVGVTTFDQPGSEDGSVVVLLARENVQLAPAQSLVRIESREDGRHYLGVVSAGPFAEPDSLRADSTVLVTVATRGGAYLPPFHGRVHVTLLGEQLADGSLTPPRLRPLPHSPVFRLSDAESAAVLRCEGDLRLGLAVGHEGVEVRVPSNVKAVLPRHTAILGTTGAGKSTTVANLVYQAQAAGMAVVLLDVEGEYTFLHEPTTDPRMRSGLRDRGLHPAGVPAERMTLYHLVRRGTANPDHPNLREFSLQFARLSPYAAMEILGLSDAQQERFLKAYDICKEVMRDLHIFPARDNPEQERFALEIDEFERGYPRMTLSLLIEVVQACLARADRPASRESTRGGRKSSPDLWTDGEEEPPTGYQPRHPQLATHEGRGALQKRVHAANPPGHVISWRALLGRLSRLARLGVFHDETVELRPVKAPPLKYKELLRAGSLSVIDLSEQSMSELNNIVIADLLRGLQETQDELYAAHERGEGEAPARVLVVIEEAHEFLSAERIEKMPVLFEQVARIAKRGRKRWLGLVFVTQLPGHLPRQVFGLVNSWILHKMTDPQVLASLQKTVHGIDEGLWSRLPGLAPGQAVVSFPHMTRPLLVSLDPTGCRLRLVE
jgi:DNA helicase HerA-like ATPase